MAFKQINEFPAIGSLSTDALLLAEQAGALGQLTVAQLIALVPARGPEVLRYAALNMGNTTSARWLNCALGTTSPAGATGNATHAIAGLTGRIKRFSFTLDTALPAADLTLTVQVNDVDTAIVATLAHGATKVTVTGDVPVLETDNVGVKFVASAADASSCSPRASVQIQGS